MTLALNRRQLVNAAWGAPVVTIATAAPAVAASRLNPAQFELESGFGIGWYSSGGGLVQVDTHNDKFLRVKGTQPGDVVSNIRVQVRLETPDYDDLNFSKAFSTGQSWSNLIRGESITEEPGATFRTYTTTFNGSVTATGSTTTIVESTSDLNLFYFQAPEPEYAEASMNIHRFATVTRGGASADLTVNGATVSMRNLGSTVVPRP